MTQPPPEPVPHQLERRVDADRPVGVGEGVARHRLEPDPADRDPWGTERMRAAVPRELRREPGAGRHASDAR